MIHVCEQGEAQRTNNKRVSISKVIPHFLVYNEATLCMHMSTRQLHGVYPNSIWQQSMLNEDIFYQQIIEAMNSGLQYKVDKMFIYKETGLPPPPQKKKT